MKLVKIVLTCHPHVNTRMKTAFVA